MSVNHLERADLPKENKHWQSLSKNGTMCSLVSYDSEEKMIK